MTERRGHIETQRKQWRGGREGAGNISGYITDTGRTRTRTSQTTVNLLSLAFVAGICFNEGGGSELDSHIVQVTKKTVSSGLNVSASISPLITTECINWGIRQDNRFSG